MKIRIATRESDLALWQAYFVKEQLEKENCEVEIVKILSKGDKILDKPLALIGGKGHFTKELEDAILENKADIAVHSLKDVPSILPNGFELLAITKRADQSDVFLSHKYSSLDELPKNAIVGTTSLRRRMQLLNERKDLKTKELRGNVNTRLRKLKEGEYDAIILAYIGLDRLDLIKTVPFSHKLAFLPPMGQASLGIEVHNSLDEDIKNIIRKLNHKESFLESTLEREFIAKIGAGCSAPVAVNAKIEHQNMIIHSMIGYPDGTNILEEKLTSLIENSHSLGTNLAKLMIKKGALEVLKNAEELAFKDERPDRL